MQSTGQKLALAAASTIIIAGAIAAEAQASLLLRQEISLFDDAGVEFGSISFLYEDEPFVGTFAVADPFPSDFMPTLTVSASQDLRLVRELTVLDGDLPSAGGGSGSGTSARVEEYLWTPLDSTSPDALVGPREIIVSNPGTTIELSGDGSAPFGDGWFFGDSRDEFFQLERDGSWFFQDLSSDPGAGTWQLSGPPVAVPEPATVLGMLAAGAIGWVARQHRRAS